MIVVTRKDKKESAESVLRRFSRKVQQSGVLAIAKTNRHFEKPPSKRDRRSRAIVRNERRADKVRRQKLGLK